MHEGASTSAHSPTPAQPHKPTDWQIAHSQLLRLATERAHLDADEGDWLLRALRSRAHTNLGFASFAEYIERLFGYSPRWTAEKLRVAEALETLPSLRHALATGDIPWSVARELTRVATPTTESSWLAATRMRTARDVEHLVSGHRPGTLPDDPIDPTAQRYTLRFDVSPEVFAALREAFAKLRHDAGEPLDDDSALLLMVRQILAGPTDAGTSSYQMALTVCPECRRGSALARGQRIELPRDAVDTAVCDAQSFALPDTHVGPERAEQSIAPTVRRHVHHRDAARCRVPGCHHAVYTDVHHIAPRAEGGYTRPRKPRHPLLRSPPRRPPRRASRPRSRARSALFCSRRRLALRRSLDVPDNRRHERRRLPRPPLPRLPRIRGAPSAPTRPYPRGYGLVARNPRPASTRRAHHARDCCVTQLDAPSCTERAA
jgi:hypothetical protein